MNALTIKALALLARQAVIDVELLEIITQILKQGVWKAEAASSMAYFVNVLHMSEDSVVRRWNAADLLDRYPHIVKSMLEGREIHLTGLSMLHRIVNDRNAEALFAEARGKSKQEIEAICCRIQPRPLLQPYVRRIAMRDDGAPVRVVGEGAGAKNKVTFTHVARFLLDEETKERLDEALDLVDGADLNTTFARALEMFVERTLMKKRRVLKRTSEVGRQAAAAAPVPELRTARPESAMVSTAALESANQRTAGLERANLESARLVNVVSTELLEGAVVSPAGLGRAVREPVGNGEVNSFEAIAELGDGVAVPVGPRTHTRYVTAKVCRAVYVRDGRRCQFDLLGGGKCLSPKNPQLHHKENYAWGGEATEENLTVFCKVHNLYQGELDFGKWEAA